MWGLNSEPRDNDLSRRQTLPHRGPGRPDWDHTESVVKLGRADILTRQGLLLRGRGVRRPFRRPLRAFKQLQFSQMPAVASRRSVSDTSGDQAWQSRKAHCGSLWPERQVHPTHLLLVRVGNWDRDLSSNVSPPLPGLGTTLTRLDLMLGRKPALRSLIWNVVKTVLKISSLSSCPRQGSQSKSQNWTITQQG